MTESWELRRNRGPFGVSSLDEGMLRGQPANDLPILQVVPKRVSCSLGKLSNAYQEQVMAAFRDLQRSGFESPHTYGLRTASRPWPFGSTVIYGPKPTLDVTATSIYKDPILPNAASCSNARFRKRYKDLQQPLGF
jgi:hypothetical protein